MNRLEEAANENSIRVTHRQKKVILKAATVTALHAMPLFRFAIPPLSFTPAAASKPLKDRLGREARRAEWIHVVRKRSEAPCTLIWFSSTHFGNGRPSRLPFLILPSRSRRRARYVSAEDGTGQFINPRARERLLAGRVI